MTQSTSHQFDVETSFQNKLKETSVLDDISGEINGIQTSQDEDSVSRLSTS